MVHEDSRTQNLFFMVIRRIGLDYKIARLTRPSDPVITQFIFQISIHVLSKGVNDKLKIHLTHERTRKIV